MLVGHYAPALAIKAGLRGAPSLFALFLAVQAVDILFFMLVPLGIERMTLNLDARGPLALDLHYMPYSHSLLVAVCYGGLAAVVGGMVKRPAAGVAVGLAIASHWLVDLLVHTPDLHLGLSPEPRVGLGLWRLPVLAWLTELALLVGAAALFARGSTPATRRRLWLVIAGLCAVQTVFTFAPPAPMPPWLLAIVSEALFLGLAALALYVDRGARAPTEAGAPIPGR